MTAWGSFALDVDKRNFCKCSFVGEENLYNRASDAWEDVSSVVTSVETALAIPSLWIYLLPFENDASIDMDTTPTISLCYKHLTQASDENSTSTPLK